MGRYKKRRHVTSQADVDPTSPDCHRGFPCPVCAVSLTKVTDSRPQFKRERHLRRRRKCLKCGYMFTTHELIVEEQLTYEI